MLVGHQAVSPLLLYPAMSTVTVLLDPKFWFAAAGPRLPFAFGALLAMSSYETTWSLIMRIDQVSTFANLMSFLKGGSALESCSLGCYAMLGSTSG